MGCGSYRTQNGSVAPLSFCRFLFEIVFALRKVVLILIAVYIDDALLATLVSLLSSMILWGIIVVWKPFTKQMHVRSLQAVLLTLQVRGF